MKIDMHLHSEYSKDCVVPLITIIKKLKERGIDGFALTDHDNIYGHAEAEKLAKEHGLIFIKGVEWKTNKGELVAYNVKKLPETKDFLKSAEFFKKQGCILSVPHPFDYIRSRGAMCNPKFLKSVLDKIDFIELNARCMPVFNRITYNFAKRHNIKLIAGSDAHSRREYGRGYIKLNEEGNLKSAHVEDSYTTIINLIQGIITQKLKKWKSQ